MKQRSETILVIVCVVLSLALVINLASYGRRISEAKTEYANKLDDVYEAYKTLKAKTVALMEENTQLKEEIKVLKGEGK